MYSMILARTRGGSWGALSIRLITVAERPEFLWFALRIVQVVLRLSPRALAWSSRVANPEATKASPISLILDLCLAFTIALTGISLSGRQPTPHSSASIGFATLFS